MQQWKRQFTICIPYNSQLFKIWITLLKNTSTLMTLYILVIGWISYTEIYNMSIFLLIIINIVKVTFVSRLKCVTICWCPTQESGGGSVATATVYTLNNNKNSPQNWYVFNFQEMCPLPTFFCSYKRGKSYKSNFRSYKCWPNRATLITW